MFVAASPQIARVVSATRPSCARMRSAAASSRSRAGGTVEAAGAAAALQVATPAA